MKYEMVIRVVVIRVEIRRTDEPGVHCSSGPGAAAAGAGGSRAGVQK